MSETGARKSPAARRAGEAVIVAACGLASVAVIGARAFAMPAEALALLPAVVCVVFCAWVAWHGHAGPAIFAAMPGLIISYVWMDHWSLRDYHAAQQLLQFPGQTLHDSVRDAHLWANSVDLGTMPVQISQSEFLKRVPSWPGPPTDFEASARVSFYTPHWEHCWQDSCDKWYADAAAGGDHGTFYFHVTYAGETGVLQPNTPGATGGYVFPQRERRLQSLLSKARLADYRVSSDWFAAIDTFDEDGWIALRKAAETEPAMDGVLTDWAKWKYHLDAVNTPADAWAALQRIRSESDRKHEYLSPSVAARAVELLVDQVDPEQLVAAGESLFARISQLRYGRYFMNGHVEFSALPNPGQPFFSGYDENSNGSSVGGGRDGSGSAISPGDFVVAQSLWDMWNAGRWRDLFQMRVGPDLLAWQYDNSIVAPLEFAAIIGGPEVDRFLLAQNWKDQPTSWLTGTSAFPIDQQLNRWLYLLILLNDDAGRQFRHDHMDQILDAGDEMLSRWLGFSWEHKLDFLLADRDAAQKFWPRFVAFTLKKSYDRDEALAMQYRYLEHMDAPASAYIDAWKQFPRSADVGQQHNIPDQANSTLFEIPRDRARPIAAAIAQFIAHDPAAKALVTDVSYREYLVSRLNEIISPEQSLLAELRGSIPHLPSGKPLYFVDHEFQRFSLWLSRPGATSPVVAMLAVDPKPILRLLSLEAIAGVPNAANRQLLQKLLSDPDATVRDQAKAVDADLKALAAKPMAELTSSSK